MSEAKYLEQRRLYVRAEILRQRSALAELKGHDIKTEHKRIEIKTIITRLSKELKFLNRQKEKENE